MEKVGNEELKMIKAQLVSCVQGQMGQLDKTDTKEMGQVVDMIKDLAETIYYCTITEAMEKSEKAEQKQVNNINYYTMPMKYNKMNPDYYRDWERNNGYMYYPNGAGVNNVPSRMVTTTENDHSGNRSMNYYTQIPMEMRRDPREGRAAVRRRMYMEGKEMHKDTNSQLRQLEAYLQELSADITEMVKDASPEERATLHQKMATLANKIV